MSTIYDQVGPENLQKLVNEFYDQVFASEKIAPLFKNDPDEIKQKQFLFLSQFLGGPGIYSQKYGHPKMRMRHLPHKITSDSKMEWLRCMKEAIGTLDIPDELKITLYNCFPPVAEHMVNS